MTRRARVNRRKRKAERDDESAFLASREIILNIKRGKMSAPIVLGVSVVLYGVTCARAWHRITRHEHNEPGAL